MLGLVGVAGGGVGVVRRLLQCCLVVLLLGSGLVGAAVVVFRAGD